MREPPAVFNDAPSLRESPADLPLDEWLAQMATLAGYGSRDAMVSDTGLCCWMDYYQDGYTPADAWSEERSCD